jgi:hypothetical protein
MRRGDSPLTESPFGHEVARHQPVMVLAPNGFKSRRPCVSFCILVLRPKLLPSPRSRCTEGRRAWLAAGGGFYGLVHCDDYGLSVEVGVGQEDSDRARQMSPKPRLAPAVRSIAKASPRSV